jgi:hypothetical protein
VTNQIGTASESGEANWSGKLSGPWLKNVSDHSGVATARRVFLRQSLTIR